MELDEIRTGFSNMALLKFEPDNYLLWVTVLFTAGYLATSLTSAL